MESISELRSQLIEYRLKVKDLEEKISIIESIDDLIKSEYEKVKESLAFIYRTLGVRLSRFPYYLNDAIVLELLGFPGYDPKIIIKEKQIKFKHNHGSNVIGLERKVFLKPYNDSSFYNMSEILESFIKLLNDEPDVLRSLNKEIELMDESPNDVDQH